MTPEIILEDGKCRCLLFSGLLQNERAEHWIEALPWQQNEIRMFGRTHAEPRLTTWMGPAYRYASIQWSDTPFSDEMARLMADPAEIDRILGNGSARAREIAEPILRKTYDIVGMLRS